MIERKKSVANLRSQKKTRDPKMVRNFLEQLSWVLNSYPNLDFRALAGDYSVEGSASSSLSSHVSKNPNIHFLVGSLPGIFSNEKFFPNNEDIVEFASEALHLSIGRWEKRSRYELIGLIVCETVKLSDETLARLAVVLSKIVSDEVKAKSVFHEKQRDKLSWNEIIQQLSRSK